jgi:3-dehydroquinate dehydratase-2
MLGTREPEKYGITTLADIEECLSSLANENHAELVTFQSNHEGEIIDKIQQSKDVFDGIIINAGGYTHTSVAIRDAISSVCVPTVEVHITNIHSREEFRHTSLLSAVCVAQVVGFKENSYKYALLGLLEYLNK